MYLLTPACMDIDPENPHNEQFVANLVGSLIQELESKANSMMNTDDLFLARCVINKGIVGPGLGLLPDSNAEIAQQLDFLSRHTQETGGDLRKMEQEQEAFALQYHECTKLNAHLQHVQTLPQNQQNLEVETKLRRQKEMFEQMLNQKVA
ncbi:unnamed protein product [Timema podura]|uniref:STAT transcription factor all-alpha domain-containing protein n=1 Tax=Timema podura TaxID=61482 RepID=A0ABN7NQR1_TIMPD|nr:unnamed protein product [Timema podura]